MFIHVPSLTQSIGNLLRPVLYLDPGSGSYLLQLLIAAVMGALLMLRVYWDRVKVVVRRLIGARDSDEGDDQSD